MADAGKRAKHHGPSISPPAVYGSRKFSDIENWSNCDFSSALHSFQLSSRHVLDRQGTGQSTQKALLGLMEESLSVDPGDARYFFEKNFQPVAFCEAGSAFFTGYFEPELEGALSPDEVYPYPLYCQPGDLISIADPLAKPAGQKFGRMENGQLAYHFSRSQVMDGALDGLGLELVYLKSEIDVYFAHIQGSVRIKLPGGESRRYSFAAKSGHPYQSIGKWLTQHLKVTPQHMTMAFLRNWLEENPEKRETVFRQNPSYIYFKEIMGLDPLLGPKAAAGVQLTPSSSLAVDRTLYPFHIPFLVSGKLPDLADAPSATYTNLFISQDTGSAITGYGRADLFLGTGTDAGNRAGQIRHNGTMIALLPRGIGGQERLLGV